MGSAADSDINLMSITKSIVALTLGVYAKGWEEAFLNTAASHWFPKWRKDGRSKILVRHLLTHTSGLHYPFDDLPIWAHKNTLHYALSGRLRAEPGSTFAYANEPTQLLAGIIEAATGLGLREFVQSKLLLPLDVKSMLWTADATGRAHAFSGLHLRGEDVVRIADLVLNYGRHEQKQILPARWVKRCISSAGGVANYGLLWWIRGKRQGARLRAVYGHGWLGQFLVVYPSCRGLAVRLHNQQSNGDALENASCSFPEAMVMFEEAILGG